MRDNLDLIPDLKRAGITQNDIAREAGCCHQNVSQFLNGEHNSKIVADAIGRLLKRARNAA
jgi:transcriptional regulator with XRE-family HTH domain